MKKDQSQTASGAASKRVQTPILAPMVAADNIQRSAGEENKTARPDVPATTTSDRWGYLEGQQGGQGWSKPAEKPIN